MNHHLHPPPQRAINGRSRSPRAANNGLRSRSPEVMDDGMLNDSQSTSSDRRKADAAMERRQALWQGLYAKSEQRLVALFDNTLAKRSGQEATAQLESEAETRLDPDADKPKDVRKRPARAIDEDDYGDEDDDGDAEEAGTPSPRASKDLTASKLAISTSQTLNGTAGPVLTLDRKSTTSSSDQPPRSVEDVRKRLEEEKKAAEERAKETFETMFYTLENDRDAMLEQQKLDELDRQVETEMSGQNEATGDPSGKTPQQGTLSSANLGASSLTLKHLIARIDAKRLAVEASDAQLRSLMSEVRKNRSKWASEEKVGQEELYEAAERVLMELKAMTEYAAPFLQKVNKREAPDYYHIIKNPMDIGTMIKKLKQLQYKSKKEFCDDLSLIWTNCMKYNSDPNHVLRKKADHMKRETTRLTQLIPEITIRDRAEVEAEERRQQVGDMEGDDADDSDEEPIIASRGRKAPSKKSKKGAPAARKAASADEPGSPVPESKPEGTISGMPGPLHHLKNEFLRSDADSVGEGSQHGYSTPPPPSGMMTPVGHHAPVDGLSVNRDVDGMEVDSMNASVQAAGLAHDEPEQEEETYKIWKQITKKDRAHVAAERHRLLGSDKINPEESALLRTKAGMRRWLRRHNPSNTEKRTDEMTSTTDLPEATDTAAIATTLADDIEVEDERMLPDYYDALSAIPHLEPRLRWAEDDEGHVVEQKEECLRLLPNEYFKSPASALVSTISANMTQMQETRKLVAKIGVVKQMQIQAQTYQNQFQKYEPDPFVEPAVGPVVVSDEGPVIAPELCRSMLQRCVGMMLYHAGFEDFQPSALETITDIAGDYFQKLVKTLGIYHDAPMVRNVTVNGSEAMPALEGIKRTESACTTAPDNHAEPSEQQKIWVPRFTPEEQVLHAMYENGVEIGDLEIYIKEDVERLASKLDVHYARTKEFLLELLRPALDPTQVGADGVGAFNDGSEQFIGGDFAEDIDEDFFGFKELGLDKEFTIDSLSVPFHLLQSRMHNTYQPTDASVTAGTGLTMEPPPPYEPVTLSSLREEISLVHGFFASKLAAAGAEDDAPLIEDEELPAKQRFPKPRLPPTGKISSPRKRPIREQQMMARKKRKLELEAEREQQREQDSKDGNKASEEAGAGPSGEKVIVNGTPALTNGVHGDGDKDKATEEKAADKKKDKDKDEEKEKEKGKKTPMKPVGKLKLDAPPTGDDNDGEGDPEKQVNGTGMLSPESLAIAAH